MPELPKSKPSRLAGADMIARSQIGLGDNGRIVRRHKTQGAFRSR